MVFTGAGWVSSSYEYTTLFLLMKVSGFKGDENDNSVLPAFNQNIFVDPYPREEQANFGKW